MFRLLCVCLLPGQGPTSLEPLREREPGGQAQAGNGGSDCRHRRSHRWVGVWPHGALDPEVDGNSGGVKVVWSPGNDLWPETQLAGHRALVSPLSPLGLVLFSVLHDCRASSALQNHILQKPQVRTLTLQTPWEGPRMPRKNTFVPLSPQSEACQRTPRPRPTSIQGPRGHWGVHVQNAYLIILH